MGRAQRSDLVVDGLHEMTLDDAVLDDLLDAARAHSSVVARLPPAEARRHVALLLAAAEQRLARDLGTAPERALRRLLRGGAATADELRVRPDATYHCVVASDGPPLGCAVETTIDGHRAGLTPHPPAADGSRVLIVAPAGALAEAVSRYPACAAALSVAPGPGVHDLLDLAPGIAFAGQSLLGDLLAARLLAGLDPHDDFHRELATTALTYLDQGQRLGQTAAALFLHPNTVRYRLRRLHEIVGPIAELGERTPMPRAVRLWWALRHWLGHDVRGGPGRSDRPASRAGPGRGRPA